MTQVVYSTIHSLAVSQGWYLDMSRTIIMSDTEIILGMGSVNERRRYYDHEWSLW